MVDWSSAESMSDDGLAAAGLNRAAASAGGGYADVLLACDVLYEDSVVASGGAPALYEDAALCYSSMCRAVL